MSEKQMRSEDMIALIDYDAGNMKSVEKALQLIGEDVLVTRDRKRFWLRIKWCYRVWVVLEMRWKICTISGWYP